MDGMLRVLFQLELQFKEIHLYCAGLCAVSANIERNVSGAYKSRNGLEVGKFQRAANQLQQIRPIPRVEDESNIEHVLQNHRAIPWGPATVNEIYPPAQPGPTKV